MPSASAFLDEPQVPSASAFLDEAPVVSGGEGDGFLAKIKRGLGIQDYQEPLPQVPGEENVTQPEWAKAPEAALRELVGGMVPHDVPSYLESIYPPAAMAHRAVDVGEQLAQGDVSGVPFVGRVPEIIAAEDTPAGSVERYRTARNTLMDLGLLAGGGEGVAATDIAGAIKREPTLAERITQPRVEPPAPQEPLAPVAPTAPEPYTPEAAAARAAEPTPPLTVEPPTPSEPVGGNVAGFEKVYGPGEIPAGETLLPEEAFAKAQARLASGAAKPYSFVARAKTGAITPTEMGDLVAEHDRLINEAAAREGTPEYDGAYQAAKDFATNVLKPAQTAWHQKGMVMQIKAPIDYSRLTGFRQAMEERIGREMMPSEAPHYQEVANDVAKAEGAARESQVKSVERVQKHYARTPDVAFEDAVQSMHKQIEELTRPCIL